MILKVTVYVDPNVPAGEGKTVDDYALTMHEGSYKLGPLSQAKAATGKEVGPRFMARALRKHREEILRDVRRAVSREQINRP